MTKTKRRSPRRSFAATASLEMLECRQLLTTVTVGPTGDYTTLSAALDASNSAVPAGSTIMVQPGTYTATDPAFFINKALTIQSTGGPGVTTLVISSTSAAGNLEVSASNVSISGFTLSGGNNGVYIENLIDPAQTVTGTSLNNLVIDSPSNGGSAIDVAAAANTTITNCTIQTGWGSGIYVNTPSSNNEITGNTIADTTQDSIVLLTSCDNNTVTANTISDAGNNGITVAGSSGNWIEGNTISNSDIAGIYVRDGALNNQILNNTINGTQTQNGIQISSSDNIVADNNVINAYFDGIQISGASNNQIYENIVTSPGIDGITVTTSAFNNYVGQNQITFSNRPGRAENGTAGVGIWLNDQGNYNWVFDNNINGAAENGIAVFHSSNNYIEGNWTTNDQKGGIFATSIANDAADSAPNPSPTDNVIASNYMHDDPASGYVNLYGTNSTLVENNFMDASGMAGTTGVQLEESNNTQVINNVIKDMGAAFFLFATSDNSLITRNRIFNPGTVYSNLGATVAWDAGPVEGGNFWSDETGVTGNPSTGSSPYKNFIYDNTGLFNGPYADQYPFQSESLGQSGDVTISEPMADTTISPGSQRTIAWTSAAAVYVDINLVSPSGVVTSIVDDAPNTGLYNWAVPTNLAPGSGYTITIAPEDSSTNSISGALAVSGSLSVTNTSGNSLQLMTPSRATVANPSSTLRVSWLSTGVTDVNVQLQTDGGAWTTLASNVTANYADVTLPAGLSTNDARIRIVDANGNASDTMDGAFTIAGTPAFTAAPTGTTAVGSQQNLQWVVPAGTASESLDLINGSSTTNIFTNLAETDSFTWIVPDANAPQAQLQLTFYDSSGNALGTASSAAFNIPGQGNAIVYNNGSGGSSGGGGGSSGASATLSVTASAKFAGNLVGGSKTKITGKAVVKNISATTFSSTVPAEIFLSTSASGLDSTPPIVSINKKITLKSLKSKTIPFSFTIPATVPAGTYYLYAEAIPSDGPALSAAAGPATIAPAFVDLSVTNLADATPIVQGNKKKPKITFTGANAGNVAAKGKATLALYASTTGSTTDEVLLSQTSVSINLKANGGTKNFSVQPIIAVGLVPAGDYTLIATLTAPTGQNEPAGDLANNTDLLSGVAIS